jgi:uncharacterized SAM-binding protein YcdF (DUF218 family)
VIRRLLKWLLILTAALIVGGAVAYCFRRPLLVAAANAWIVNEPCQKADAIVVLGGGVDTRPMTAAKLFLEGWAPRILVLQPELSPAQQQGLMLPEGDTTRQLLESLKVPAGAIETLKTKVTSTADESVVVAEWARDHHSKCLLIPTDAFHTRRAGWIMRRHLAAEGTKIVMVAAPPRRYALTNWWQSEYGVLDFQNETLKYAYYLLKY